MTNWIYKRITRFTALSALIILVLSNLRLNALDREGESLHFSVISIENGLSTNIVNRITEDYYGFIWIATPNGLNRYDGRKLVVFNNDPADSFSLPANEVTAFTNDNNGDFWIGTKKGLCRFNYGTEKFERFLQEGDEELNSISSLYTDSRDQIWIGTEDGIFFFDKRNRKFIEVIREKELLLSAPLCFAEHSDGTILAGIWEKGFYRIAENRKSYSRQVIEAKGIISNFEANTITSIQIDKNGHTWLGSREGLILAEEIQGIGPVSYKYTLIQEAYSKDRNMIGIPVHALCEDNIGRLWIGTENGLNIYDPVKKELSLHVTDPDDPTSLNNNNIRCIFKDRSGNIWIGTYQGGINLYHPGQNRFKNHFPVINDAADPKTKYVKSVLQDRSGRIWIGTDIGLYEYSAHAELLSIYMHDPNDNNSLNMGGVSALLEDKKGRLWVGTWGGGLHLFNEKKGNFIRLPWISRVHDNPGSMGDITARTLAEDWDGNIWIGNIRGYLDCYDPENKIFKHYRIPLGDQDLNAVIQVVKVDPYSKWIWVGTQGGGLIRLDPHTGQMERFGMSASIDLSEDSLLNCQDVFSLLFKDSTNLWLGTSNGIQIINRITGKRTGVFSVFDGLPGNTVTSILDDENGNIWISTLNGISRYNQTRDVFINYNRSDGILINAENGYKSPDGWLFFGGVNGINAINPAGIRENYTVPPIVFTGLKIFGKPVEINENSVLTKSINLSETIYIRYEQNVFSLEFAALNYIKPENNQYKCKLEGFDEDWISLGSSNEARYTNLDPGIYTFRLKAANNDGVWNETGRTLRIEILPPWYRTLWFKILLLILIFLIILSWILVRTFRLREQQTKLKRLVQERTYEIEKQQVTLQKQAAELIDANNLLIEKQNEILAQKEAIAKQNEVLAFKNNLLEDQNNRISEQRLKEQKMASKLHEADQMKLAFFTNISHEFRTPLTLILGPMEKLLSEISGRNELAETGRIIQRNTLRLLNLINQFLDLSKIEAGVARLNVSYGDISQYLNSIVSAYRFTAQQKRIRFSYHADFESCMCYFDADKLEKITYNLLTNAFKFTCEGGEITVIANLLSDDHNSTGSPGHIQIKVVDTGRGIEAQHLERIFERFYQVESSGNEASLGTGIGLSLTSDLVKMCHGKITVLSEPGKGSSFIVTLPVKRDSFREEDFISGLPDLDQYRQQLIASEEFDCEDEISNEEIHTHGKGSEHLPLILIIDDNRDIRKYLFSKLSSHYYLIEASDGQEGLNKALKYNPKLVICDVMMPGMNGYELCEKLKTDMRTCHIPVIILTAKASQKDQIESLETGADAYISKPFNSKILEKQINQLINSREQLKQFFKNGNTFSPDEIIVESSDKILLNRIIKVMSSNLSNPDFGVEELGREVGLSRAHLYRKLKQMTGHSAIEFVRNMRLQRAAQLFRQNRIYVAEVAYLSGFKELSYFRKIFREFYGMSPQEYINGFSNK